MPDDFEELDPAAVSSITADSKNTPDGTAQSDAAKAADAAKTGADEPKTVQINNEAELAALGQLADLGITPSNAAEFVQAKGALDSLNKALATDPDTVLSQLEAANSDAYFALLDKAANRFLKHFPPEEGGAADGSKGSAPKSDPRVDALVTEVQELRAGREQEVRQARAKTVETDYNKRIDGMIEQASEKAKLTGKDKDYLRLKVNALVAQDETARRRITQGVFVDLPKHFNSALSAVAADIKTVNQTELDKRNAVTASGTKEVISGAEAKGGADVRAGEDEWDAAARAFAADLVKS